MKELKQKVAVVTGAGDGIGHALALAFAKEGMNLVLVDISPDSLETVEHEIRELGVEVMSKVTDVSDRDQMFQLADAAYERFGHVHILCNNAGIGGGGPISELQMENWDWMLGVNLYGVIYGVHYFLKRMLASGEEGHIVNTASIAGMLAGPVMSTYHVAKFGVVAFSESLFHQLRGTPVGVSVLCPGFVKTSIVKNGRKLAAEKKELYNLLEQNRDEALIAIDNMERRLENGMSPGTVAQMVINSIQAKRLYILPDPEFLQFLETRMNVIRAHTLDLKDTMASLGVYQPPSETVTYTHAHPHFSIMYPSDWVEQRPMPSQNFVFRAVSSSDSPDMTLYVSDIPSEGLSASLHTLSQKLASTQGTDVQVTSEKTTQLADGTPALEGEIDMGDMDGVNRLTILVLNAIHKQKLISVRLLCLRLRCDAAMKQKLWDVAHSLSFQS